MNRADDGKFTRPLAKALACHVDRFAATMPRDAAVAWVHGTVLAAWAEDHGLTGPWLRKDAAASRGEFLAQPGMTTRAWLARAVASLACHPATWCLLDPQWTPLQQGMPSREACDGLLAWWEAEAPSLACETAEGPGSLSGWIPGDLLQHLSEERRKKHALAQTPWWVADFILDMALVPACGEFPGQVLRVTDPACGTGHLLIRAIDYLWEWYTTGSIAPRQAKTSPVTGGTILPPADAARAILAGLHGADRDPLTAAVARLRYTVAVGALMHEAGLITGLRLDRIPPFQVPVIPADTLLAGVIPPAEYAALHPGLAAIVTLPAPQAAQGSPGLAVPARPQAEQGILFGPDAA